MRVHCHLQSGSLVLLWCPDRKLAAKELFVFFQAYGKYKLSQLGTVIVHSPYQSTVTAITNIQKCTHKDTETARLNI